MMGDIQMKNMTTGAIIVQCSVKSVYSQKNLSASWQKKTEFETFDMQFCGFLNLAYLATFVTFESHRFTGVVKHTE